jgi:hypothetical protein
MASPDNPEYKALDLPPEDTANGGSEILRAGMVDQELFVTARRAFSDPAKWGDVLAEIARRVALLYSAEDTDLTEQEILAEIEEAFAADLGARVIKEETSRRKPAKRKPAERKPRTQRRKARASTRKSASARKRVRGKKR